MPLDKRTNVYRHDLADLTLRDTVTALRYVEPTMRQCLSGVLPILDNPSPTAKQISQIRYGEFFDLFEERGDGFLWIQNRSDRYVGYIPNEGEFGEQIAMRSNRITALRTFLYPEPSIKVPPIDVLTLGSYVSVAGKKDKFLELTHGGFVFTGHVMATEFANNPDYVFTAGRMLHTPYLWGGRTPDGLDCSGLVQLALEMAGIEAPRDSDQQCEAYGQPLNGHWRDHAWERGELVFILDSGKAPHVGIMTGADHMIHANATTMGVSVEPLAAFVERGNEITAVSPPLVA